MANIYVKSSSGATITLSDGTSVGAIPVLVQSNSPAVGSGLSSGSIIEVSPLFTEQIIDLVGKYLQPFLGGLSDVDMKSKPPVNGDILGYDGASGKWRPNALPASSGSNSSTEIPTYSIELTRWGISNDGTNPIETTLGINNALIWANQNGYVKVKLPQGTYLVDKDSNINLVSDMHFQLDEHALIRKETNGKTSYTVVYVGPNTNNVTISGGEIKGDRYTHDYSAPGTHENSYCLLIEGATNVLIERIKLSESTGDGLCIGSNNLGFIADIYETDLESGGIDDNGNLITDPTSIRTNGTKLSFSASVFRNNSWHRNFSLINSNNLIATSLNIYFYKVDNTFISATKNRVFNEIIDFPDGAAYCKVTLNQPTVPNVGDGQKRFAMNALAVCYRVSVRQCDIGFNRRQAITLGGGYYMTIDSNVLHDIGGTAPESGIDVEGGANPNWHLHIVNNTFYNNVGYDIILFDGKYGYIANNSMGSKDSIASLNTNNAFRQYTVIGNTLLGPMYLSANDGKVVGNTVINSQVNVYGSNIMVDGLVLYNHTLTVNTPNPYDATLTNLKLIGGSIDLNNNAAHFSNVDIYRGSFGGNVTAGTPTFSNMRVLTDTTGRGINLCQGFYDNCTFMTPSDAPTTGYGVIIQKPGKYVLKNCNFKLNTWLFEINGDSDTTIENSTFDTDADLSWGKAVINVIRAKTLKLMNNVINAPNQSGLNFSVIKINPYGASTDGVAEAHIIGNIVKTPVACKGISTSEGSNTTSYYVIGNIVQGCFLDLRDIDIKHGNIDNGITDPYNYKNAAPTSGKFKLAQIVYNSKPIPGGYLGWVCTSAGTALSKDWTANTAYSVNTMVRANNKVYKCTVAGTSGTTAPSHTSGAATDGTVIWLYVDVLAVFNQFGPVSS
jgi:hypothetical protein